MKMTKIVNVIGAIVGLCAFAGGFAVFLILIAAMVSGQITIGSNT